MANFFPPSQLPPLKGRGQPALEEAPQPKITRAKRLAVFFAFLLFGLVVAAVGFRLSAGVLWFFAVPVAAALGWYAVANWSHGAVIFYQSRSQGGPVLW